MLLLVAKYIKQYFSNSITFVKMTSESQDNNADVSEKSPEFSEDAKIVDADGKEVESKNVVASTENLSEAQVTEVKEKLCS